MIELKMQGGETEPEETPEEEPVDVPEEPAV